MTMASQALDPRRWRVLPAILVATFMGIFDFFVVNVAAPDIERDLRASSSDLQLIVGGYAFAYAAVLIIGGRLGDRYSYRRLFVVGMVAFAAASAACGLAQTPAALIAARLGQGLAAAAMLPQVLALITALFPAHERHRALAWFGVTVGLAAVSGQILGGVFVEADLLGWGWRTIFLVNVPIGVVAVAVAARLLPDNRSATRPQLDLPGAIGVTGALALALVPLTIGRGSGWPSWMIAMLGASLPAFALVLTYQARLARRGGQPVLDLSLFELRSFSAGLVINAAFYAYVGTFLLGLTLCLQAGLGRSALEAGLTFAPLGVGFAATSLLVRPLIARHGTRVVWAGLVVALVALLGVLIDIHLSGTATSPLRLGPVLFAVGLANGVVLPSMVGAALLEVPATKAGAAAGTLVTGQQFAIAAGVAVLGELFFALLGQRPSSQDYIDTLQYVLLLDVVLVVACIAVAPLLPRPRTTARSTIGSREEPQSDPAPAR
jgi:EmrB/QacA subfamily drug resistance transporter